MHREEARRLLGVRVGAPHSDVERAFRQRARFAHPDRGGDPAAFRDLITARSVLAARAGGQMGSRGQPSVPRSRLVVRSSRARRMLRAVRSRLRPRRPARVH